MARKGVHWKLLSLLPITAYPVSREFRRRSTVGFLAVAANILTQGQNKTYTSVLLTRYVNNSTVSCTARSINIGDSLYSHGSGVFKWGVTGIKTPSGDGTGFGYNGALLQANATMVSMLYSFAGQSYNYEVCANVSVPTLGAISVSNSTKGSKTVSREPTIISMCSTFDPTRDYQSTSGKATQNLIQNKAFGIAAYLQDLNFANGSFPNVLFPPYGMSGATPPSDTSITPAKTYDLSMWLDGFLYLPDNSTFDSNVNNGFGRTHSIALADQPDHIIDIQTLFEETMPQNVSGLVLNLNGIGGVRLQTAKLNSALGFTEPSTITQMRNYTLNTLNLILDLASNDLQNREVMSSYLCTVTSMEWKTPLSMIAMLLGNNAALFGFILGLLVAGAQMFEEHHHGPDEDKVPILGEGRTSVYYKDAEGGASTYYKEPAFYPMSPYQGYAPAKHPEYSTQLEDQMPMLPRVGPGRR
ncbi:hypothetical protein GLOTRDRAFT_121845 [Gloeophyllum trabeum ATCC 11539]|uniref:Uncharacterized protein n=1 Tax=Gloeophyllum trabeum (strain ATCC 11539 / FP-39264 / Madison 617) TaxID=670483 RepID=S7RKJ4_GLOTA|nr:uncharacterized protein GLOTRDRAFT_121845 [Gloeophyllum trabeum ATCC 11539]EPQ54905.1 hypothetical protein GLOTRDRAFT_121845 [Gloeophyllum trabeum ATCC 11539]